jgi:hypothetical protein
MNDLGWTITSILLSKSEWQSGVRTAYRLDSKPLKPREDWYDRQTGMPRPPAKPEESDAELGPLFAGVRK